jgi:hypothetical protein
MLWATTVPGGKQMPVDVGSAGKAGGNLAVWRQADKLMCRVLKKGEAPLSSEWLGTNHWTTCKRAEDHRRPAGWYHSAYHHRVEYRHEVGTPEPYCWMAEDALLDWSAEELAFYFDRAKVPHPPASLYATVRKAVAKHDPDQQMLANVVAEGEASQ